MLFKHTQKKTEDSCYLSQIRKVYCTGLEDPQFFTMKRRVGKMERKHSLSSGLAPIPALLSPRYFSRWIMKMSRVASRMSAMLK